MREPVTLCSYKYEELTFPDKGGLMTESFEIGPKSPVSFIVPVKGWFAVYLTW